MRETRRTEKITCDLCGEECEPINTIEVPIRYFMDLVHSVRITVVADIAYGTDKGDVCPTCLRTAMKRWLDQNPGPTH